VRLRPAALAAAALLASAAAAGPAAASDSVVPTIASFSPTSGAVNSTVTMAAPNQGSITGVIAPDGTLVASLPYGDVGVVAADVDLALADRRLALRLAPERL
jgi:hypothetical protein